MMPYSCSDKLMISEVSDGAVILDARGGEYFGLDPVGLRFLKLLDGTRSFPETVKVMLAEYDVDHATLEADLKSLLDELIEKGLVNGSDA